MIHVQNLQISTNKKYHLSAVGGHAAKGIDAPKATLSARRNASDAVLADVRHEESACVWSLFVDSKKYGNAIENGAGRRGTMEARERGRGRRNVKG